MREKRSQAIEDYLKAIYELTIRQERASTNEIAERMGVTPASVTGMIQKLAGVKPPLVEYEKHRGAALTAEGKQAALEIIRHHRLLETYLHQKLGFPWEELHEEADQLEHVISEDLEEHIAQALGDPDYDPHGDPIPSRDFRMPDHSDVRLSQLRPTEQATVQRILDDDPDLLRHLGSMGITPGCRLTILDYSPFDDNLRLQVGDQAEPVVLGPRITEKISVIRG